MSVTGDDPRFDVSDQATLHFEDTTPLNIAIVLIADTALILRALIEERYPVYAVADLTVQSREVPHDKIVDEIVLALADYVGACGGGTDAAAAGMSVP